MSDENNRGIMKDSDPDDITSSKILQEFLKNQKSICIIDESNGEDGTHIKNMLEAFMLHLPDILSKDSTPVHKKYPTVDLCDRMQKTSKFVEVKLSKGVTDKIEKSKELLATFSDFDIHDAPFHDHMMNQFRNQVLSFSARAIERSPAKSTRSDEIFRDLIMFDPILLEEYMRRNRETDPKEDDEK